MAAAVEDLDMLEPGLRNCAATKSTAGGMCAA